jgi:hypothetical protein
MGTLPWGVVQRPWAEIAEYLREFKYDPPPDSPGHGVVFRSDESGRLRVIAVGAKAAEEFISAIEHDLMHYEARPVSLLTLQTQSRYVTPGHACNLTENESLIQM